MNITINLDGSESSGDLAALSALIDSLAGRSAPETLRVGSISISAPDVAATLERLDAAPAVKQTVGLPSDDTPDADDQPTTDTSAGQGLDVNGLPWDERIHAGSKTKNADGSWRARRGVADDTVASVTAGLRAGMAARATAQPETAPLPPVVAPPPPPAPPAPPVASTGTEAPPAPTVSETPAAPDADAAKPFAAFQALTKRTSAAGLVYVDLNAIAQAIGLTSYADVAKNEERIPEFILMAEAMGKLPQEG